jgi:hypothetical protein
MKIEGGIMKTTSAFAFCAFVIVLFFAGCTSPEPGPTPPESIEITGTWSVSNIDPGTGGVGTENAVATLSNTTYSTVFSTSGSAIGAVLAFDNANNFWVMLITSHFVPSFIGYYEKVSWQLDDPTHVHFSAYSMETTQQLAENSTTIIYGPTIAFTKL